MELRADLAAGEIAGNLRAARDSIGGVDVHIRVPGANRIEEIGQRVPPSRRSLLTQNRQRPNVPAMTTLLALSLCKAPVCASGAQNHRQMMTIWTDQVTKRTSSPHNPHFVIFMSLPQTIYDQFPLRVKGFALSKLPVSLRAFIPLLQGFHNGKGNIDHPEART